MKELFKSVQNFIAGWRDRKLQDELAEVEYKAYTDIQLKEYKGDIYIAINNVAYINVNDLKVKPCDLIEQMRKAYIEQWENGLT